MGRGWVGVVVAASLFVLPARLSSQEQDARNRVYLELLGPGIAYSFNYERALGRDLGIRVGASGWPESGVQYVLGFAMMMARLGHGAHSAILGAGAGVAWFVDVDILETTDVVGGYGMAAIGYQWQPKPRGFFLRLSYTPLFGSGGVAPLWGGLSVGVAF